MIKRPETNSVLSPATYALRAGVSAAAVAIAAMAGPALAQTTPAQPVDGAQIDSASGNQEVILDQIADESDIIVTGTLLRGVAPVGTNVVSVNREDILKTGAASANDLLANIPQVGNFGTVPVGTGSFALPIVRPNIRNLAAAGGSSTLVLLNGHRMVGAGVLQTTVDPSVLPPEVIDRVEVVPDGGSAIYGSDAIGGVINFITRSRFNGLAANVRYGFADNYQTVDGSLTAGKDWGSGSLLVTYAYAWHDNIQNRDRDYTNADHSGRGGQDFRSQVCSPGNMIDNPLNPLTGVPILFPLPGNTPYAMPGLVRGAVNKCDTSANSDFYPREERHTVFASLTQHLSDHVEFSATAYWSRRDTTTLTQQPGITGLIWGKTLLGQLGPVNPYFQAVGTPPFQSFVQSVSVSFDDVFGPTVTSKSRFDSYGVTPSFKFDLGHNWQLRTEANFGRSDNLVLDNTINTTAATNALAGLTKDTALNPYNLKETNAAVLAAIRDFQNYGHAVQELAEGRVVLDGSLARLPGGDIRLAIGGEYHYENLRSQISQSPRGDLSNSIRSFSSRNVKSAFAELLIPIFGADNAVAGLRQLNLSGSIRHDDYSDQGGSTNPKVGVTWKPVDQLTIRGNYGTSFHAPSLADTTSTSDSRAQILLFSPFRAGGSPTAELGRPTIVLAGGNPALKPETAHTWSAGFDWKPTIAPGLVVSATYYNVNFKDAIQVPPFTSPIFFSNPGYKSFYTLNPTLQQSLAAVGNLPLNGAPSIQSLYALGGPYVLIDARRNNIGAIKVSGIDFNVNYLRPTGFGSINLGVSGTYTLSRKNQAVKGDPFSDELKNGTGRLALVANAGGTIGDFTALAKLNYRDGYPILGLPSQSRISSFTTVDLFFSYALPDKGALKGTMLTLNVDNVFDRDPPYSDTLAGYANGSTLGRLVSVGLRKKF
jgi:iron complex outermembrane receptor protein